jgi:hypothetical protein
MKRTIYCIASVAFVIFMCTGCLFFPMVEGSGFLATSTYGLAGFTQIDASYAFKVRVVHDAVYSVSVISDDNLVEYLDVHEENGTLYLTLKPFYNYFGTTLTAEVHAPALTGVSLSGASEARVESGFPATAAMALALSGASIADVQSVSCNTVSLEVSGGSTIDIASLSADMLSANLSGASSLTATGSADGMYLNLSGASQAHLADCPTLQATANLSGGSCSWVRMPAGTVWLNASGGSLFYYYGNPTFASTVLSGGSLHVYLGN